MASHKVIFSGIQPTGIPHLGNYFGALRNWVDLQNKIDPLIKKQTSYYSIVDLHSLTSPNKNSVKSLPSKIFDTAASLLAIGIDPEKSVLFRQSAVPEHTQLSWILNCSASFGELNRMTQWKVKRTQLFDKNLEEIVKLEAKEDPLTLNGGDLGLFTYPVLQAADILLYKATHVPIGQDQRQHLELTRNIAQRYNKTFASNFFPLPADVYTSSSKVYSLTSPGNKMSKSSLKPHSVINLTDSPEVIQRNIKRAITDSIRGISYDPNSRPGVANLIQLFSLVSGLALEDVIKQYEGKEIVKLKEDLSEAIIAFLAPINASYRNFRLDENYLRIILASGADKARMVATDTLSKVYSHQGL